MPTNSWLNDWATGDVPTAAEFRKLGGVFDSTLSGVAATIDITGLPTTYAVLIIEAYLRGDTAATSTTVSVRFNNDSGANYNLEQLVYNNATPTGTGAAGNTGIGISNCPAASAPANMFSAINFRVPNYGGATNFKALTSLAWHETADTAAGQFLYMAGGVWKSASAINRVTLIPGAGNFAIGSRVLVYVKGS